MAATATSTFYTDQGPVPAAELTTQHRAWDGATFREIARVRRGGADVATVRLSDGRSVEVAVHGGPAGTRLGPSAPADVGDAVETIVGWAPPGAAPAVDARARVVGVDAAPERWAEMTWVELGGAGPDRCFYNGVGGTTGLARDREATIVLTPYINMAGRDVEIPDLPGPGRVDVLERLDAGRYLSGAHVVERLSLDYSGPASYEYDRERNRVRITFHRRPDDETLEGVLEIADGDLTADTYDGGDNRIVYGSQLGAAGEDALLYFRRE